MNVLLCLLVVALSGCVGRQEAPKPAPADAPVVAVEPEPVPPAGPPEDAHPAEGRVVIIGVPGLDPARVERWRRDLPNLDAMLGGRANFRLATTTPPSSPVAWTSFATATGPGEHGVFGFVDRDLQTLTAVPGVFDYVGPTLGPDGTMQSPPEIHSLRQGTPFWDLAAKAGKRVKLLFVPYAYPPEHLANLTMLAGEGLPDLRLTNSTFTLFGSDFSAEQDSAGVAGGDLVRLSGEGPFTASVRGPELREGVAPELPVELTVSGENQLKIKVGKTEVHTAVGAFSDWVTLDFPLSPRVNAHARVRFYAIETAPAVRVYMSPLANDPAQPLLPLSAPTSYAGELFQTYGDWQALGWAHDTAALSSDLIPERLFVAALKDVMDRRLKVLLGELGRRDAELFVGFLSGADAASHVFVHLGDPSHPAYDGGLAATYGSAIKETYQEVDAALGELRRRLRPDDTLIVVSECGFDSFRTEFNVNTWLLDNQLLHLLPGVVRADDNALSLATVDWKRTSAYAVGSGAIYLNLKGREPQGSVPPAKADAVLRDIASKLLAIRYRGVAPLSRVLLGAEVFHGAAVARAPDLVLAFQNGYQTSRATWVGGVPLQVVTENKRRWSGDHASSDAARVPGFLLTNLANPPKEPSLLDVGPTALALLGIAAPAQMEGKAWVELRQSPSPAASGAGSAEVTPPGKEDTTP